MRTSVAAAFRKVTRFNRTPKPCLSRCVIGILCLSWFLSTEAIATAEVPSGRSDFEFIDEAGNREQPIRVWLYRPEKYQPHDPVIVVMHGMNRDGENYRQTWIPTADEFPCLIVVPEFSAEHYEASRSYQFGNLRTSQGDWNDAARWTFTAVERVFDHVRRDVGSTRETYYLFGHSAGSQFVHRMLLFSASPRVELAFAANAGSYTMPTHDVEYPYGLGGSPVQPQDLGERFARPLVVLLGENDRNPDDPSLPTQPGAQAQGPHRLARGELFFSTAEREARRCGAALNWQLVKVPKAGHSNVQMAPAAARMIREREQQARAAAP